MIMKDRPVMSSTMKVIDVVGKHLLSFTVII